MRGRSHYHTSDLQTSLTTFEVGKDDGPCSCKSLREKLSLVRLGNGNDLTSM